MSKKLDRFIEKTDDLVETIDNSKSIPDFIREYIKLTLLAAVANETGASYPRERDVKDAFDRIEWPDDSCKDRKLLDASRELRKKLASLHAHDA